MLTPDQIAALSPDALAAAVERARAARAAVARESAPAFCEFVLRDETTGAPIRCAPLHLEFHRVAEASTRSIIWAPIESGKSQQITVGRVLWMLGRDPSLRVAVVSSAKGGGGLKFTGAIRRYIDQSAELRAVFPDLARGTPWTDSGFRVAGAPFHAKDYSVEAVGEGGAVLGSRYDLIVIDDLLDFENTYTEHRADKVRSWLDAQVFGRLTPRGRIIMLSNVWTEYDAAHVFARRPEWASVRLSILDSEGRSRWAERWPMSRIAAWPDVEKPRQLFCVTRSGDERVFQESWIRAALMRGMGRRLRYSTTPDVPVGGRFETGVDLAVKGKKKSDRTAFVTVLGHPDGTRELAWVEAGKGHSTREGELGWSGPDIVERVVHHRRRYVGTVRVEDNAAQEFIVQFAQARPEFGGLTKLQMPVKPFTTGMNKHHPEYGIAGLAAEMAEGRWVIPCDEGPDGLPVVDPRVEALINQMRAYDPRDHTGDELMALWFAREGLRQGTFKHQAIGWDPPVGTFAGGAYAEPLAPGQTRVIPPPRAPTQAELIEAQRRALWSDLQALTGAGAGED